ncbi:MAG: hypothetical protein EOM23_06750 [Candidatus Moranbacteria bacterium]|nr:hypothetical protein [Sphingobacteriia bacterium]NCU32616.1 hypothetical protein [Candidatus Moranbacteria bacterium]
MELKIEGKRFSIKGDEYNEILRQIERFKEYLNSKQMSFCEWRKKFGHEKDSDLKIFLFRNNYTFLTEELGFKLLLCEINPCPMGN